MKTSIEWTDKTWNPVTGCTKVSAGCKNCYAETLTTRFGKQWGNANFTDVKCHEDRLMQPFTWKKPCKVFVNSMSDLFHESVPIAFIDRIFAVMAFNPQHTFQVLTKRPERMLEYCTQYSIAKLNEDFNESEGMMWYEGIYPFPNVHLGVSVENQIQAEKRIPYLLDTPAAVRFLSCEPLLGEIDLENIIYEFSVLNALMGVEHIYNNYDEDQTNKIDWVIIGAESGPKARPMQPEWAEKLVMQCQANNTPVFVKQLCEKGRKIPYDKFPESLQVRQFPKVLTPEILEN